MKEKTCVILDIDGTLWDTRPLLAEAWNEAIRRDGRSEARVDPESLKGLLGRTMADIARRMLPDVPPEARKEIMDACTAMEHRRLEADLCRVLYPGVAETLRAMAPERRLFIVSNCENGYVDLFLRKTGLGDVISDAEWYGRTLAHKGISIQRLMERQRIHRAVYVGDTQGDLEAAGFAGIPFVFAAYGFGSPARWDHKLGGFWELGDLMPRLDRK